MNRRVLVVDDSTMIRRVARQTLEEAGYEIEAAEDGQVGLRVAQQFVPDLIFVDMVMPNLDGRGFCEALRSISNLQDIPIVLMSATVHRRGEPLMKETGAIDAIQKPFSPESLLAVAGHVLSELDSAREPLRDFWKGKDHENPRVHRVIDLLSSFFSSSDFDVHSFLKRKKATECLQLADELSRILYGGEVTFQGRLDHVSLVEVFQLLQHQIHGGTLYVEDDECRAIQVYFRDGAVDFVVAKDVSPEFLLGRYLVRDQLIAEDELEAYLERPRGPGKLGEQLVRLGYLRREELSEALIHQSSELVYEALRWSRGRFAFVRYFRPEQIEEDVKLEIPVTGLIMEGLRRVDEWRLIQQQVTSFELVPRLDARRVEDARERLNEKEKVVLDAVDGSRNVREIVAKTRLGSFDVCKMLYQFISARFVTL